MADTMTDAAIKRVATGVEGSETKDDFIISEKAIETINNVRKQNEIADDYYLRIGTRSGGCSGMSYSLGFDNEVHDFDKILKLENMELIIDNKSLFYLMGVTLDYVDGPNGSGFVFNNPNNAHSCGCSH